MGVKSAHGYIRKAVAEAVTSYSCVADAVSAICRQENSNQAVILIDGSSILFPRFVTISRQYLAFGSAAPFMSSCNSRLSTFSDIAEAQRALDCDLVATFQNDTQALLSSLSSTIQAKVVIVFDKSSKRVQAKASTRQNRLLARQVKLQRFDAAYRKASEFRKSTDKMSKPASRRLKGFILKTLYATSSSKFRFTTSCGISLIKHLFSKVGRVLSESPASIERPESYLGAASENDAKNWLASWVDSNHELLEAQENVLIVQSIDEADMTIANLCKAYTEDAEHPTIITHSLDSDMLFSTSSAVNRHFLTVDKRRTSSGSILYYDRVMIEGSDAILWESDLERIMVASLVGNDYCRGLDGVGMHRSQSIAANCLTDDLLSSIANMEKAGYDLTPIKADLIESIACIAYSCHTVGDRPNDTPVPMINTSNIRFSMELALHPRSSPSHTRHWRKSTVSAEFSKPTWSMISRQVGRSALIYAKIKERLAPSWPRKEATCAKTTTPARKLPIESLQVLKPLSLKKQDFLRSHKNDMEAVLQEHAEDQSLANRNAFSTKLAGSAYPLRTHIRSMAAALPRKSPLHSAIALACQTRLHALPTLVFAYQTYFRLLLRYQPLMPNAIQRVCNKTSLLRQLECLVILLRENTVDEQTMSEVKRADYLDAVKQSCSKYVEGSESLAWEETVGMEVLVRGYKLKNVDPWLLVAAHSSISAGFPPLPDTPQFMKEWSIELGKLVINTLVSAKEKFGQSLRKAILSQIPFTKSQSIVTAIHNRILESQVAIILADDGWTSLLTGVGQSLTDYNLQPSQVTVALNTFKNIHQMLACVLRVVCDKDHAARKLTIREIAEKESGLLLPALHNLALMHGGELGAAVDYSPDYVGINLTTLIEMSKSSLYSNTQIAWHNEYTWKPLLEGARLANSPNQLKLPLFDDLDCFNHRNKHGRKFSYGMLLAEHQQSLVPLPHIELVINQDWKIELDRYGSALQNRLVGKHTLNINTLSGLHADFLHITFNSSTLPQTDVLSGYLESDSYSLRLLAMNLSIGKTEVTDIKSVRDAFLNTCTTVSANVDDLAAEELSKPSKSKKAAKPNSYFQQVKSSQIHYDESETPFYSEVVVDRLSTISTPYSRNPNAFQPVKTWKGLIADVPSLEAGALRQKVEMTNDNALEKLAGLTLIANDPGDRFPLAVNILVHNHLGVKVARDVLVSPAAFQADISAHHRANLLLRRDFPLSLPANSSNRIAYLFELLHRFSQPVRQRKFALKRRFRQRLDRLVAQVLQAAGLLQRRHDRKSEIVTAGNFTRVLPKDEVVAILNLGQRSKGHATIHTPDLKNTISNHLIQTIRSRNLPVAIVTCNESYTSQTCPKPTCLRPPQKDWLARIDDGETVTDTWIRSRVSAVCYKGSQEKCHRVLQCEKCYGVYNRDLSAAEQINYVTYHTLLSRRHPYIDDAAKHRENAQQVDIGG